MSLPLFILYGSATGNASHISKTLAATLQTTLSTSPYTEIICTNLDSYKKTCLPIWSQPPDPTSLTSKYPVIIICSTTGNGDSPENSQRFVRMIKKKPKDPTLPRLFQHCTFAVLGLGDTNYDKFCETAKILDRSLDLHGGTRAQKLVCADEATGLEDTVEPWIASIDKVMKEVGKRREEGGEVCGEVEKLGKEEGSEKGGDEVTKREGDDELVSPRPGAMRGRGLPGDVEALTRQ